MDRNLKVLMKKIDTLEERVRKLELENEALKNEKPCKRAIHKQTIKVSKRKKDSGKIIKTGLRGLTEKEKANIIDLRKQGIAYPVIEEMYEISRSSIYRLCKAAEEA